VSLLQACGIAGHDGLSKRGFAIEIKHSHSFNLSNNIPCITMNKKLKSSLFLLLFFAVFFILAIRHEINLGHENKLNQQKRLAAIGNIQFKGKVIRTKKVMGFGDKGYYMMCVQLDYTNTDNFFIYNDINFLKIKKGIASMSGGIDIGGSEIDYVEVNLRNNGKEKCYYKNGKTDEYPLSLGRGGVTASDINTCN
jgi:hypothetical protein